MPSQKPLYAILFVVAIGVGFYIHGEVSAWPTEADRVLAEANAILKQIKGISK